MPARQPTTASHADAEPAANWQLGFTLLMLTAGFLSIAVSQLALGLALLALLWRWLGRRQPPVTTGLEATAAVLALWALAMVPLSTDVAQSALYYRRFYLFTAIWTAAGCATSERRRLLLLACLLAGALATCVHDQVRHVATTGGLFAQRMTGTFNAMTSGALLMMALLLALGFLATPGLRRRLRLALLAAVPILGTGMLMTMTRSAQMGLVAGIGALLLAARPRLFAGFAAAVATIALVVVWQGERFVPPSLWSRIDPQYVLAGKDTELRLEMWRGGLEMVRRHPITGVGDRGLEEISRQYYTSAHDLYFGHLHSNPVHMAAIWGLPGLLAGQAFLLAAAWLLWKRWRALAAQPGGVRTTPLAAGWTLGALAVWAGFYVAGFTEWYFGDAEPMLIFLAILGIALSRAPADQGVTA